LKILLTNFFPIPEDTTSSPSELKPKTHRPYDTAQVASFIETPLSCRHSVICSLQTNEEIFDGSFKYALAKSSIVVIPLPPPVITIPAGSNPFLPIFFK
jgi:hypothetical protein